MSIPIGQLKPNKSNPRKITPQALDMLCTSIDRDPLFMELRPIIIDEKNIIIGGNQRYTACKKLGYTELPDTWVRVARGITEEQRKRFIIIDNAPEGMAGVWDNDILQVDFGSEYLSGLGYDLDKILSDLNDTIKMPIPVEDFPEFDEDIDTEHKCPKCGYKWSGKSS